MFEKEVFEFVWLTDCERFMSVYTGELFTDEQMLEVNRKIEEVGEKWFLEI